MNLDVEVEASGFGKGESRKLEEYMEVFGVGCDARGDDDDDDDDEIHGTDDDSSDGDHREDDLKDVSNTHVVPSATSSDIPDPRRNQQNTSEVLAEPAEELDEEEPTKLSDVGEEDSSQSEKEEYGLEQEQSTTQPRKPKNKNKNHAKLDLDEEEIKNIVIKKMQRLKASNFTKHHTKKSVKHANHSTPLGSKFKNDIKSLCSPEF